MRLFNKISILTTIILFLLTGTAISQSNKKPHFKVVIDAGHGGKDSGARGTISVEKDVVLSVALQVGQYLKKYQSEIEVIYTRDDDTFVELYERANIANKAEADLFISIHANSSPNKKALGTETFMMGLHKSNSNLKVAQKENAVIALEDDYSEKYEGYDPHSAESYIIFTLMQNTYLDQSLIAADFIQTEFREKAHRKDRGVKQAGFLVLWKTTMPSVLVEIGFVSNEKEEKYLNSEQGRDYMASAIFRAIRAYYQKYYLTNNQTNKKSNDVSSTEKPLAKKSDLKENTSKKSKTKKNAGIFYSVQLTASSTSTDVSTSPFNQIEESVEMKKIGNYYKYYAGKVDNYNAARKLQKKCLKYFPDAFIVAFEGQKPISVSEAISKQK